MLQVQPASCRPGVAPGSQAPGIAGFETSARGLLSALPMRCVGWQTAPYEPEVALRGSPAILGAELLSLAPGPVDLEVIP